MSDPSVHPFPHTPVATAFRELDAQVPIVLLPIRLETRYFAHSDPTRVELRIRMFPDTIHVGGRRQGLSTLEMREAKAYWEVRARNGADADASRQAWTRLVAAAGDVRAIHAARVLQPTVETNGSLKFPAATAADDPSPTIAQALPDRWFVSGRAGDRAVFDVWGAPVPAELAIDPPAATPSTPGAWLMDYAEAEAKGMAVRAVLTKTEARSLETIVAFGVREAETPEAGAQLLGDLWSLHAADAGVAFVPVGTQAKNTAEDRSGFASGGAAAERARLTFEGARAGSVTGDCNGARLAQVLGIPPTTFASAAGALERSDAAAAAANTALWPATWGYYLEQMMNPLFSADAIGHGRDLFEHHVRARGPLPTVRVGRVPYGVLPIAPPLAGWRPFDAADPTALISALSVLEPSWRAAVPSLPRVGASADPAADPAAELEAVMAIGPTSQRIWVRQLTGRDTARAHNSAWDIFGNFDSLVDSMRDALVAQQLAPLRLSGKPRLADFVLAEEALVLDLPLVGASADPSAPLAQNYASALAGATVAAISAHQITGSSPRSLLYLLLRHGLLITYARASDGLQGISPADRLDLERVHPGQPTVWTRLGTRPSEVTGGRSLAEHLATIGPRRGTPVPSAVGELAEVKASFLALGQLSAGELARLTAETLDLCSHRLDAWITAVASRRLAVLRQRKPSGTHVGGFGILEAPPLPPDPQLAHDGAAPQADPTNQGFLLAPSLAHANTAAILRAGFLGHRGEGKGSSLAVNLSSERVRRVRWLLEGVAEGQAFAALVGYRAARLLADIGRWDQIDALCDQYPQTVTVDGSKAGARVIDGVALFQALQERAEEGTLSDLHRRLYDELFELIDGTSDVLVAEAIHQTVRGQPERARAALEALETYERPVTDPDVVATPPTERRTTIRIALALPGGGGGWPSDALCGRALAEPTLNAWVSSLLGAPSAMRALARCGSGATLTELQISVADLTICALDVVMLAGDDGSEPPLFDLVRGAMRLPPEAVIDVQPNAALAEALYLARAVRRLLGRGRALRPEDLVEPGSSTAADVGPSPELHGRVMQVRSALQALESSLGGNDLGATARAAAIVSAAMARLPDGATQLAAALGARRASVKPEDGLRDALAKLVGGGLPIVDRVRWTAPAPLNTSEFPPEQAGAWLHDYGRVRRPIEALDEIILLAPPIALNGFQLGAAGRLFLAGPVPSDSFEGLLVDQFIEATPELESTAAAAFHYDAPNAAAPQTLLVAVPGDVAEGWDHKTLADTILRLLDLAKLRLVPPAQVASQFLPAAILAENLSDDVVSTHLSEVVVREIVLEE